MHAPILILGAFCCGVALNMMGVDNLLVYFLVGALWAVVLNLLDSQ